MSLVPAGDLAQSRQPFVVSDVDTDEDSTSKAIKHHAEEATGTSPEAQRKRVNRILKLIQQKATMYELLGVDRYANEKEIVAAWKRIIGGIHPDKNKDPAAKECTQNANTAKELLLDPERRYKYDKFLDETPPPPKSETFDEEFAQGAFDDDSDSDAVQEDDSVDDGEQDYPLPDRRIRGYHTQIGLSVQKFFADIDEAVDYALLKKIEGYNKKIENVNRKYAGRILTMYQVPEKKLAFFQYLQRRIPMSLELKLYDFERAQKELSWLQEYYEKTRKRGLYSWPAEWAQWIMEPLYRKLETLGMPSEQRTALDMKLDTALMDRDDDVVMGDRDEEAEDSLRRGYTIDGEPILGYIPIHYPSKSARPETHFVHFRYFVKVDGINPIKFVSGREIGYPVALAYDGLPDHKKNNIHNRKYECMDPQEFVNIIGITWVPSPTRPHTYIWASTRTKQDDDKPTIMTKSTFFDWVGKGPAKIIIEDWFAAKGIQVDTTNRSPTNLLLTNNPLPKPSNARNLRPRVRTSGAQLPPSEEDSEISVLTAKVEQLTLTLATMQEQMLNRLLPAP